jgi:aspartate/methionine/tyrosine aminotransferase
VDPERLLLTSSTSEAYSLLFKLLCDPGDDVLVPTPSYPLFEWLTRLDGVRHVPYRLTLSEAWGLDRSSLESAVGPRTRAILVVSPNNPTGSLLHADDAAWLVEFAATRRLAVIVDEVFVDYPLASHARQAPMPDSDALTFRLGGLSKSAGLPQVKLAWVAVAGQAADVEAALSRLDVINDSYLSASTPVQQAAGRLLAYGDAIRPRIYERVRRNLMALEAWTRSLSSLTLVRPEAGWSAVVRIPATASEENAVLRLIREAHVLVHPGYFFDFPHEAFLVLSLLPRPEVFDEALSRAAHVLGSAGA